MELGEADAQAFRRTLAESKEKGTIEFLTQGLINRQSSYVQVCDTEINGEMIVIGDNVTQSCAGCQAGHNPFHGMEQQVVSQELSCSACRNVCGGALGSVCCAIASFVTSRDERADCIFVI